MMKVSWPWAKTWTAACEAPSTKLSLFKLLSPVFDMLGRVFNPSTAVEAYIIDTTQVELIDVNRSPDGLPCIKNSSGESISIKERDFYVPLQIVQPQTSTLLKTIEFVLKAIFFFLQPKRPASIAFEKMPSTLFHNAQENSILNLLIDDCPVHLILKQQHHPNISCKMRFEQAFSSMTYASLATKPIEGPLTSEGVPPLPTEQTFASMAPQASLLDGTNSSTEVSPIPEEIPPLPTEQTFASMAPQASLLDGTNSSTEVSPIPEEIPPLQTFSTTTYQLGSRILGKDPMVYQFHCKTWMPLSEDQFSIFKDYYENSSSFEIVDDCGIDDYTCIELNIRNINLENLVALIDNKYIFMIGKSNNALFRRSIELKTSDSFINNIVFKFNKKRNTISFPMFIHVLNRKNIPKRLGLIPLGEDAFIYTPSNDTQSPVSDNNLAIFNQYYSYILFPSDSGVFKILRQISFLNKEDKSLFCEQILFDISGIEIEDISILVDKKFIFIIGTREKLLNKAQIKEFRSNTIPSHGYLFIGTIPNFNFSKFKFTQKEGVGSIAFYV